MTETARRTVVLAGAAVIVLVAVIRLAACGAPHQVRSSAVGAHWALAVTATTQEPDAGEGTERPGRGEAGPPPAVVRAARRALATYRTRELQPPWRRARVRLPALRPLVVAPTGHGRWRATAITRRGELYLVIEVRRTARRIVVTAVR
jgi:hypothetical protein